MSRTFISEGVHPAFMGDVGEFEATSGAPAAGRVVCSSCFGDADIRDFIQSNVGSSECDFCRRKSRTRSIAAPLDDVFDFIFTAIDREYQPAVEVLAWESAEGGYQGHHWDSAELLEEIGLELPLDDGELLAILVECLGDEVWCERNPHALRKDDRLVGDWEEFCSSVKHQSRYFFLLKKRRLSTDDYPPPAKVLKFIGKTVTDYELVKELQASSLIYRARQLSRGQLLQTPYDFGPPPIEFAVRPNRMSPAGIVMFYGSDEAETAVAEIDDDRSMGVAIGTFRTTRKATILDLTKLPPIMGFFEQQSDSSNVDRYELEFLRRFVRSLAAKVGPGSREHIDYVPTQVVTEWFRTAFRYRRKRIDGIRYMSAQRPGGKSLVLFADRFDLVLDAKQVRDAAEASGFEEWELRSDHREAWLKLVRRRTKRSPRAK